MHSRFSILQLRICPFDIPPTRSIQLTFSAASDGQMPPCFIENALSTWPDIVRARFQFFIMRSNKHCIISRYDNFISKKFN